MIRMTDNIRLKIVNPFPPADEQKAGMMWRYPKGDYKKRDCWWILMPTTEEIGTEGHRKELSWRTTDRPVGKAPQMFWKIKGHPPDITVTPSIKLLRFVKKDGKRVREGSYWHGSITKGYLVEKT